ncbi:hypothetical protein B0T16DRAFT_418611 [Cercophora newfieldiana]|uniref:Uncharacterized protein n=1 Tax=Cercophora newfieldiana TaxID=92897 RepID=A0AA39XV97_9PEZI|nr:hypothetical protein B0T16DRAFT_418611 [Cercophora newfieldiana]
MISRSRSRPHSLPAATITIPQRPMDIPKRPILLHLKPHLENPESRKRGRPMRIGDARKRRQVGGVDHEVIEGKDQGGDKQQRERGR